MIQPEHDTIRGLITYLNYRKDTGHSAARVDPDQEESWARQLELLLEEVDRTEESLMKLQIRMKQIIEDKQL